MADTATGAGWHWRRPAACAITAGYVVATALVIVQNGPAVVGYETTLAGTVVALTAAAGLVAAALLAVGQPTNTVGVLLLLVCAWLAPIWVGWSGGPPLARSVAMPVIPLLVPCVLHLALIAPAGRFTGHARLPAVGGYVAAVAAGVIHTATYDPFLDSRCWNNCTVNDLLVRSAPAVARTVSVCWLAASAGLSLIAAVIAAVRLARATPASRWPHAAVLVPVAILALAETVYAVLQLRDPSEDPADPWLAGGYLVRGAALTLTAAGLVAVAMRAYRRRAALSRLVHDLGAAPEPGALTAALARSLGDPDLYLAYWLPAPGRFVDPDGRPADQLTADRVTTEIRRADDLIAVVRHHRAVDPTADLSELIGSAARLAIDNERLRVALLAQLDELAASRRRLVDAADAARRGLERDLHDGAQQHLLAVVFELRLARQTAGKELTAALDGALETAATALGELRELAHGIFPAVLDEAGLEPALRTLADQAAVPMELAEVPEQRLPAPIERAAYLVVSDALDAATTHFVPGEPVCLRVWARLNAVHLEVEVTGAPAVDHLHVTDRVGALGGRLTSAPDRLHAEIPLPPSGDATESH